MTKVSRRAIDPKDFGYYVNNLWSVFTLLDSKEHVRALFRDLFTHTEYKMFAKRLEIARRLLKGQTYDEITSNLKVTNHTISTINNILARDGSGLKIADQKLLDLEKSYQRKRETHQDVLERRNFTKNLEQILVKNIIKAGVRKADQILRRRTRETTSRKELSY